MKKRFMGILIFGLLISGCSSVVTPTDNPDLLSDSAMATQISQMLTSMPTSESNQGQSFQPQITQTVFVLPATTPSATVAVFHEMHTATSLPTLPASATPTPDPQATQTSTFVTLTATQQPSPTATITTAPEDPHATLGEPDWEDTLEEGANWPLGDDDYTAITIDDGRMALTALTATGGWRMATTPILTDFYAEMTMQTGACAEWDHYGFFFRVPIIGIPDQGYLFGISCSGGYSLKKWDGKAGEKGEMRTLLNWTLHDAIMPGTDVENRIGVMAVGNRISLYANGTLLEETSDDAFASGYLGVFVNSEQTDQLTVYVEDIRYWRDP